MERGHAPDAGAHAFFLLGELEVEALQEHRQAFGEKDAAQQGNQQFLPHEHGAHANDAANGQAPRIAHKHLGREGVVPQEADGRSDECRGIHYQFTAIGDVHDIQVG